MQANQMVQAFSESSSSKKTFLQLKKLKKFIERQFLVLFALPLTLNVPAMSHAQEPSALQSVVLGFKSQALNKLLKDAFAAVLAEAQKSNPQAKLQFGGEIVCDTTISTTNLKGEKCKISVPEVENENLKFTFYDMPESDKLVQIVNEESLLPIQNGKFQTYYAGRTSEEMILVTLGYKVNPEILEFAIDLITRPKNQKPDMSWKNLEGATYTLDCKDGGCLLLKDPSLPGFQLEPEIANLFMSSFGGKALRAKIIDLHDKSKPEQRIIGIPSTGIEIITPLE